MRLEDISVFEGVAATTLLFQIQETYLGSRPRVTSDDSMDAVHRRYIRRHPVVMNQLYQRLLDGRMTADQYQFFFSEYNQASQRFFYETVLPEARSAHGHESWQWYIAHIVEEESEPGPHWQLFADFMKDCGFEMRPPASPAHRYATAMHSGYVADLPFAAGYALALEVQAGYEIAVLNKALQRHFPDQMARTEWFDAHLAEGQEEEHSKASVEVVEAIVNDAPDPPVAMDRVRDGFTQYCDDALVFMDSINQHLLLDDLEVAASVS